MLISAHFCLPKIILQKKCEIIRNLTLMMTSKNKISKIDLDDESELEEEEIDQKEDVESFNNVGNESDNSKGKEEEIVTENQKKNQTK